MPVFWGNKKIKQLFYGSKEISKGYYGTTLFYKKGGGDIIDLYNIAGTLVETYNDVESFDMVDNIYIINGDLYYWNNGTPVLLDAGDWESLSTMQNDTSHPKLGIKDGDIYIIDAANNTVSLLFAGDYVEVGGYPTTASSSTVTTYYGGYALDKNKVLYRINSDRTISQVAQNVEQVFGQYYDRITLRTGKHVIYNINYQLNDGTWHVDSTFNPTFQLTPVSEIIKKQNNAPCFTYISTDGEVYCAINALVSDSSGNQYGRNTCQKYTTYRNITNYTCIYARYETNAAFIDSNKHLRSYYSGTMYDILSNCDKYIGDGLAPIASRSGKYIAVALKENNLYKLAYDATSTQFISAKINNTEYKDILFKGYELNLLRDGTDNTQKYFYMAIRK